MLTTPETKRKQVYLSNRQKWEIAKWCIENKCVIQDIHAYKEASPAFIPFTLWRVKKKQACLELNEYLPLQENIEATDHHLTISVQFYNEVCELTGSHPNVPAIEDTVEKDMLVATNKRLENDLVKVTQEYQKLQSAYNSIMKNYGAYFGILRQIAQLIPADCFGVKKVPEPKIQLANK